MYLWRIPYSTHGGLMARAAPGTHEAVLELLRSISIPRDAPVLDLAAGTGALLSRLSAEGFSHLQAVERDLEHFGFHNVTPLALDLNASFSSQLPAGAFRLITAIEIIEHLDSPRAFLQEIQKALAPNGYAIISTPNVAHWLGRIQFLLTGELKFFTLQDFHDQRHISPILDQHMRIHIEETGFELMQTQTTASSWGFSSAFSRCRSAYSFD